MNGSDLGLSVVDTVDARANGDGVEKAVLVAVHPPGADNGSGREGLLNGLLSLELGAVELGSRVGGGVQVGKVDEAVDAGELGDASKTASSRDVDVVEVEVPASVEEGEHAAPRDS